jgi:natural product precursor
MKKKIEVKLELNKQTIAKLDPRSMKKIKGGGNGDGDGVSQTDAKSNGADCSCACCASTES